MRYLLTAMTDLVFPPVCVFCDGFVEAGPDKRFMRWAGQGICGGCLERIPWLRPPYCPICAKPFASTQVPSHLCGECSMNAPPFTSARALMVYRDEVFSVVHKMKYEPRPSIARFLGEALLRKFKDDLISLGVEGLIPVPLHLSRLRSRGFNQSALVARKIGKGIGLPVKEKALVRSRWTEPQVGLSRLQRKANVKGAFQVQQEEEIRGGVWLLVDDVYTTGSTVNEASKELIKAGSKAVHVLTVARVL